jgi:putative ABC transport system substrate-binding protein
VRFHWRLAACIFGLATITAVAYAEEIAVVMSRDLVPYKKACYGLRRALEGAVLTSPNTITRYDLTGNTAQAQTVMDQIANSDADVAVTIGTEATLAARRYLAGMPVVYCMVMEALPFENQPSAGVLLTIPEKTKLDLLKRILPQANTVGVLYDAAYSTQAVSRLRAEASERGLRLLTASVSSLDEIPNLLERFAADRMDALLSIPDPTTCNAAAVQLQTRHCLKHKLPYWAESEQAVRQGACLALAPNFEAMGAQAAELVRQVLETGESLPARPPEKLLLSVNEETRKNLGLADLPGFENITVVRF